MTIIGTLEGAAPPQTQFVSTVLHKLTYDGILKNPAQPTTEELIKLSEAGPEAWTAWRRDFPPIEVGVQLAPVYTHVLMDPENPSIEALQRLANIGELWEGWRRDVPKDHLDLRSVWCPFLAHPERPTREELFALARAGAELWNAWREAHPQTRVDFYNQDFRGVINFAGFKFPYETSFAGAAVGDYTTFAGAEFGALVSFVGAQFGDDANFHNARFGQGPSFAGARFGDRANFARARFRSCDLCRGAVRKLGELQRRMVSE